jgi:hypothetical protein
VVLCGRRAAAFSIVVGAGCSRLAPVCGCLLDAACDWCVVDPSIPRGFTHPGGGVHGNSKRRCQQRTIPLAESLIGRLKVHTAGPDLCLATAKQLDVVDGCRGHGQCDRVQTFPNDVMLRLAGFDGIAMRSIVQGGPYFGG